MGLFLCVARYHRNMSCLKRRLLHLVLLFLLRLKFFEPSPDDNEDRYCGLYELRCVTRVSHVCPVCPAQARYHRVDDQILIS